MGLQKSLLLIIGLATIATLGCGGGEMGRTLTITPPAPSITTNNLSGKFGVVVLNAKFSDGTVPTNVHWSGGNECIPIDKTEVGSSNLAMCNLMCSGTSSVIISATAEGVTGTSKVTCTWTDF